MLPHLRLQVYMITSEVTGSCDHIWGYKCMLSHLGLQVHAITYEVTDACYYIWGYRCMLPHLVLDGIFKSKYKSSYLHRSSFIKGSLLQMKQPTIDHRSLGFLGFPASTVENLS